MRCPIAIENHKMWVPLEHLQPIANGDHRGVIGVAGRLGHERQAGQAERPNNQQGHKQIAQANMFEVLYIGSAANDGFGCVHGVAP